MNLAHIYQSIWSFYKWPVLIALCLLITTFMQGQSRQDVNLPPLPVDQMMAPVIFPAETVQNTIDSANAGHSYLFPVLAGETVRLTMMRQTGDLVPFLQLSNAAGEQIIQQPAQDLAGREAQIVYTVEKEGWYLVNAGFDTTSETMGRYSLTLSGTTTALYDLLTTGPPPDIQEAIYLIRSPDVLVGIEDGTTFLLPLHEDETIHADIQSGEFIISLEQTDNDFLVTNNDGTSLRYLVEETGWYILNATGCSENLCEILIQIFDTDMTTATRTPYRLMDLITPSPSPTYTITPTATASPTATMTLTPSPTPIICPGALPSRLQPDQTARVIPGPRNNMRDRPDLSGGRITQIPGGGVFEVLSGPVCADGYAWYQVNYNGIIGWTAEADDEEYWLEPFQQAD